MKKIDILLIFLIFINCSIATATENNAKCAPYIGGITNNIAALSGDFIGSNDYGLTFINTGQAARFMQSGTVNEIKFYAENTDNVTELYIIISRENEETGLFNVVYTSNNLASSINDGLNTLSVSIPVLEGDYYGLSIKTNSSSNIPILTINDSTYDYQSSVKYTNQIITENWDWFQGIPLVGSFNGTIAIDFYMESPNVVFIGDSIISGHPLTYACTPQNQFANFVDYQKGIPYKFQTLSNLTYQNVGISGDSYPNLYNRFSRDVVSKSPDYVIIEGGVNDLASGEFSENIFPDIQNAINLSKSNNIIPLVVLVLPAYGFLNQTESLEANELNNLIINFNTTIGGFYIVDARDELGSYSDTNGWTLDLAYQSDDVHLNEAGNAVLAQKIYDVLSQIPEPEPEQEQPTSSSSSGGSRRTFITPNTTPDIENIGNEIENNKSNLRILIENFLNKILNPFKPYIPDFLDNLIPDSNENIGLNNSSTNLLNDSVFDLNENTELNNSNNSTTIDISSISSYINNATTEFMLDSNLLEETDINGNETFVELTQTSLEKHPTNFLLTVVLMILIIFTIGYYIKEK